MMERFKKTIIYITAVVTVLSVLTIPVLCNSAVNQYNDMLAESAAYTGMSSGDGDTDEASNTLAIIVAAVLAAVVVLVVILGLISKLPKKH